MDDQELQKLLDQLHSEIDRTETVDEKGRELLREIETDIHGLLERSEGSEEQPQSATLQERLDDTINHFEITHPALTMALSKLSAFLSNAGI